MLDIITGHPITFSICALAVIKLLYDELMVRVKGEHLPKCPKCKKPMITKVAKQGKHIGKPFWGCVDYRKTGCDGFRTKGLFDKDEVSLTEIEYQKKLRKNDNK
ncbi:hypothetical protein GLP21_12185 [Photobacterium carnosum]|uniref:DNA topoisomerase type IA zn finger domain-containing protein n=1 Tax=Photobacterium carnosum TaxID=2023717 RepID=A0A2N4UW27_9GAMM|nr:MULTISPECIES: hypothetical protein [Photobacterium]MCD9485875.1 hypothetical protein [Photobacterium iliopiscarium]MCD9549387.1 hypothetical protein [Photobacterium carnosum]MCD9553120.1 hypothetical protein [Photobacterium carnosum]MCF2242572.1 hypothetical protein [Photobacterium iliopiscarium]MCF2306585.1 hypothetical protein [Photobacterium carnosum]